MPTYSSQEARLTCKHCNNPQAAVQAQVFVEELTSIYDNVVPCFPPSYKIFTVVFRQYHKQIDDVLYSIGCCTSSLANNDILKVHLSSLRLCLCNMARCLAFAATVCLVIKPGMLYLLATKHTAGTCLAIPPAELG